MTNKALRYSILCNKKYGMGELVNFLEADCLKLSTYPKNLSAIFSTSYFLIFAIVFMAVLVGVSFLAGLGVMIVASVINSCFTGRTRIIQSDLAKATDSRMRLTNEVFNNIKFIKVNAWEEYFYDKLVYRRTLELAQFKNRFLTEAYSTLILWMFPKLILAATFGTYIAVGGLLTPAIAFSVIFMYAFIQFFLQNLPVQISSIVANGASFKRI
jgi:ABC-type multidrug transport system fused ATPase/permease subunit